MAEPAKKKADEKKEDPQVARDRVLREVVKHWNLFINHLAGMEKAWKEYSRVRVEHRVNVEEFPLKNQKALSLANPRGELDIVLNDLILRGPRWAEHLNDLIIK